MTRIAGDDALRQVRERLAAARREGADFDAAWATALRGLPADVRAVLVLTSATWMRAYTRAPAREWEAALVRLGDPAERWPGAGDGHAPGRQQRRRRQDRAMLTA